MDEIEAPGLRWRPRAGGRMVPYWIPTPAARAAGYPVKSANLASLADRPALLVDRCHALNSQMLLWLEGKRDHKVVFNGTFGALLDRYSSDPESTYQKLKSSSSHPYRVYLPKLRAHIGAVRIDLTDGRDVMRWWDVWSKQGETLAAAGMTLSILKAAVSWGIVCRLAGCREFKAVLAELTFPKRPRRTTAPAAAEIEAIRRAAHRKRAPGRALAYAIQFETTARQYDIWGEWVPLSDPRPSAVIFGRRKWIGPTWAQIDENLIFTVTPTKTESTTGVTTLYDLSLCPMVMAELAHWPPEKRVGPLIINEKSGRPYLQLSIRKCWRADATEAGLPTTVWNRDLRAGGITEGGKAGATLEDRAKAAGHSSPSTTAKVYDRDTLEAHRRLARARTARRGAE